MEHPNSLLLLLYKRISGTRHVGIDDIPALMDEYDLFEDIFFERIKEPNDSKRLKINGVYEYINHLRPPFDDSSSVHIPYRILIQQANLFKNQNQESDLLLNIIFDRLKKYRMVKEEDIKKKDLINKITLAMNWVGDFNDLDESEGDNSVADEKVELTSIQKEVISKIGNDLTTLASNLENKSKDAKTQDDDLAQEVQTIIFNNAKNNHLQPKEIFKLLYKILINSEKGPRLGNYIVDLGIDNVVKVLEKRT